MRLHEDTSSEGSSHRIAATQSWETAEACCGSRVNLPATLSIRQKTPRKQTESLQQLALPHHQPWICPGPGVLGALRRICDAPNGRSPAARNARALLVTICPDGRLHADSRARALADTHSHLSPRIRRDLAVVHGEDQLPVALGGGFGVDIAVGQRVAVQRAL